MPEYLAPGVYLEEYDADPQPIPGVSTSIDDATARALIERFKDLVPPDWAGFNESDPGVTLANLFAWLGENLLYRTGHAADARREAAVRILAPLLTCGPPMRPRYFVGQLLDAATLAAEQNYHRDMRRRHNLALHGFGIVSGLGVHVGAGAAAPHVVVEPGYAIDPRGEEHTISKCATLRLPAAASKAFVSVRRWERACDAAQSLGGEELTRIEDASIVAISASVPTGALALASLDRGTAGWSLTPGFTAPVVSMVDARASKNFRIRLRIDGVTAAAFSEMAVGSTNMEPADYREGADPPRGLKLGRLGKTPDITLKRGVVRSREFHDWLREVDAGRSARRRSVVIAIVDEIGNEQAQLVVQDAFPKKYDPGDLNARGNDLCIDTLELGNEGIDLVG